MSKLYAIFSFCTCGLCDNIEISDGDSNNDIPISYDKMITNDSKPTNSQDKKTINFLRCRIRNKKKNNNNSLTIVTPVLDH